MSDVWTNTILSVVIVSLVSLIGVLFLSIKMKKLNRILHVLVSFATGALFGDVFLHLMPEIAEKGFAINTSLFILSGLLMFFVIEKFVQWHHCHHPGHQQHKEKPLATMNLVGDGLHNLIDGMIIAGSYLLSFEIGLATTLAVLLHEIPQEIGDFAVLLYSGYSKSKALLFNFLSAITSVVGAILVLALAGTEQFTFLIPFTVGGFIYIAGADLLPELHKEKYSFRTAFTQLIAMVAGITVMYGLLFVG
ncbi:MAG: ZIP family metal transporter [Nanoarchaeota archaeon]